MSPSYADTVKLVEDNYFHWEFNMHMKLSHKGLLTHIIKPEFDAHSDRSTPEWKTNDLKALGVIAGDVSLTYQAYIRGSTSADQSWSMLEEQLNKNTLKNRLIITKKLHNFKMEPGNKFAVHVDRFKELVLQLQTIGEHLDETRQLVLLLGSLTDEYIIISTVLDNSPNVTLAYAIQALSGVEASDESSSAQERAFATKKKEYGKRRFKGIAKGTVKLKLMDGTTVTLSDVLYIPEVEASLISVSKLAEKDVVEQFGKDKCVFHYGDAKVMEAKRCGNVYKLKTVGDEVCHIATTSRKEPWAVVHARLGHIPYKRYEQLLAMAEGVPRIIGDVTSEDVCAGCCMGKMRADDYPRHPEKLVKSAGVLDLVHSDVMGPMQTKTPGGCTYVVTFIDDYSRHVKVYFMKAKSEVLAMFTIFKAAMENATGKTIKRLRSDNGGEYTGRQFKVYLNRSGIKHQRAVPYTPQQNGLAERMNRSLVEMARCMLYHEDRIPGQASTQEHEGVWCARRVLNIATGKVQIVRTVKFIETTNPEHVITRFDVDEDESATSEPQLTGRQIPVSQQIVLAQVEVADVIPLQRDTVTESAMVPYESTHPMITRSRARHIDETTEPEEAGARKKQVIDAPSSSGTKRQRMTQERTKPTSDQLAIEGGQAMAAIEGVSKSYEEATTNEDKSEWKKAIASELASLIGNKTWKLVPRPGHQRPIGCRWVFALKHNEKGEIVRHKARLVVKGYSQRHSIDYEETYSLVAYLNSIRAKLAKCCADGMHIEQCDVDTAFLYGKLEEEIYMELPEGLRELMTVAGDENEDDVVCLLLQSLYGLKQASRVWNETIDKHLKSMGFKAADADPCVYTRGESDEECIVWLYVDDMLIASQE
ncbi:unnamed protein product [Phytophthora lilii]|uniref:Unnamed protein product n=1 Tax=Phytophthora lilii TaxID=2077276 RepID=A0A9W6X5V4_9STRA|nr:unnamed protein product [Phytophthora lilii]